MLGFSSVMRVMVRPFRGYAELAAAEGQDAPSIVTGVARLLFVIGAFVSITATGRLAPAELFGGALSFSYAPVVQVLALAAALRVFAPTVRLGRAFALYLEGHGPWLLLFCIVSGACLFAPSPARLLPLFMPAVLVVLAWGYVLTFACLRSGLGLTRARALGATALFVLLVDGLVLTYFLAAGQLRPIIPW